MPQAAHQHEPTPTAPAPGVTARGIRAGELRTRAVEPGAAGAAAGASVASTFDPETLTFEFVLLTTRSCPSYRYILYEGSIRPEYTEVEEQLDMAGCEGLDELAGASILNSHRYWDIEDVVGVIEAGTIEGDALVCRGRLSRRDAVAGIAQDLADGILRNFSGGFDRIEETLTLRDGLPPLVTVTRWTPREGSLVPVPADPSARIRSGAPNVSKSARIVSPPNGQRADAAATDEDKAKAEAARAAAEAAVTAAQATLESAQRALDDLKKDDEGNGDAGAGDGSSGQSDDEKKKAKQAKADGERKAAVDALRGVAKRNGRLDDFEALLSTGAPVAELRTVCVAAIATRSGEIGGVSGTRSGGGTVAAKPALLTRSAYAAHRAGLAN